MTRKDYVLIADAIRGLLADIERGNDKLTATDWSRAILEGEHLGARNAASRLADSLRQDNPRFDRTRFMAACGL